MAFSPDGTLLARGCAHDTVRIWDVAAGRLSVEHRTHDNDVTWVQFSPDGTLLASSSSDRTIVIWDVAARAKRATLLGHTDRIDCLAFSPDGGLLAAAGKEGTVRVYDMPSGETRNVYRGHLGRVQTVAFAPDGLTLASGDWTGAVMLWDAEHFHEIRSLDFGADALTFADDRTLWAAGRDGVASWDVRELRRRSWCEAHDEHHEYSAFTADCRNVARCGFGTAIRMHDTRTGELLATLEGEPDSFFPLAFLPDGQTLIVSEQEQRELRVWDAGSGRLLQHRASAGGGARSVGGT